MIGKIFGMLILLSVCIGAGTGRLSATAAASISGAGKAVELSLSLLGMMGLWSGIMRVLEELGVSRILGRLLSPLMRILFPDATRKGHGVNEIAAAFSANLLGIGNAATPLAIEAMEALSENNRHAEEASDDMITFTALGCACPSLLPTTLLALRSSAGALDPLSILPPVWIGSVVCSGVAVFLARALRHFSPPKRKEKHAPGG